MRPAPTHVDVRYGPHERNVLDVWAVEGEEPAPCVMAIHGGGWTGGDKSRFALPGAPRALLKEGIALVAINYRYVTPNFVDSGSTPGEGKLQPRVESAEPPVKAPLYDAARALQFVRSRAGEWNIDPRRIAVTGGSAGGCSCLWLAFHDDLADPEAADPVARQSTKPLCAATIGAQTTLDPAQILEWMPNATYGGHAFGYTWDRSDPTVEIRSFLEDRQSVAHWIRQYSPYALADKDDPPVYLTYGNKPARGEHVQNPTHSANYGALLAEKLAELGVPCEFVHRGVENPRFKNSTQYLVYMLKRKARAE